MLPTVSCHEIIGGNNEPTVAVLKGPEKAPSGVSFDALVLIIDTESVFKIVSHELKNVFFKQITFSSRLWPSLKDEWDPSS